MPTGLGSGRESCSRLADQLNEKVKPVAPADWKILLQRLGVPDDEIKKDD